MNMISSFFFGLSCLVIGYTTTSADDCTAALSAHPPDPKTGCCGVDISSSRLILVPGTAIDQYPWLALIEYVKDGKVKTSCGGSLISGKFVLTSAICVTEQALTIGGKPTNIRLGEYDTSNDGPDCVQAEAGGLDCTEGVVRIPIEKIIPHPEYESRNQLKRNDIALIKMKELAPYTDFIRPICLPTTDVTLNSSPVHLYFSGWATSHGPSSVKLRVELPLVDQDKCQSVYSTAGRNITLWKGQLCAGGEKGKDSCKGDGGLPLMYDNDRSFEVVGIVSIGPTPCGQENVPSVYTNVYEYLPWIKSIVSES